ncbi:MAG: hypothetical protein EON88_05740 [Brevundimonas sp.]|nr:MAG: hypothetical protein EON88_05740 [Brevundimonas sp.]
MRTAAMAAALWAALAGAVTAQSGRPVIASEADLPPVRFPATAPPSQTLNTPAFLEALPGYRAEAERLLADYDIRDPAIAQRLRYGLTAIAILQDRPADAMSLIQTQRAAESKPQLRQIGSMVREALAAGLAAGAAAGPDGRCAASAAQITRTLGAADPLTVRDEVIGRYGVVQSVSPAFHAASAALVVDPEAQAQGSFNVLAAMSLANMRAEGNGVPPCRTEIAAALKAWIDDPAHKPVDIWPAREVAPEAMAGAQPVTVAVWESGFDPNLFPGQLAIDPAEPLDGVDNDGNGVIDDAFGPTFDAMVRPTQQRLPPPSPEMAARLGLQIAIEKGLSDLAYGDDTPEARFVAERSRSAGLEEQLADIRVSSEWNGASHASWVASLIADPAPFVRLYAFNLNPYGDYPDPQVFVEADIQRWADALPAGAARLRGAGVRIVNMSWVSDADGWAEGLMRAGRETDPERAATRGAAMAAVMRTAIDGVIRDCPDILFVVGAGNSDQPEEIQDAAPQTLNRPNILVVGGTGASGRPTAFTTYGSRVRLYALAEGNVVRSPGGQVMRRSGTSFASPMTARVAAQMLAVAPGLRPEQVIQGLLETAQPGDAGDLAVIHPAHAVEWAKARR